MSALDSLVVAQAQLANVCVMVRRTCCLPVEDDERVCEDCGQNVCDACEHLAHDPTECALLAVLDPDGVG